MFFSVLKDTLMFFLAEFPLTYKRTFIYDDVDKESEKNMSLSLLLFGFLSAEIFFEKYTEASDLHQTFSLLYWNKKLFSKWKQTIFTEPLH